MANLKGSRTEANLWAAFAGESQARNKYSYFKEKAKSEGYEQIAQFFYETEENEKAHAKIWFKLLGGIENTQQNLLHAAESEHYEGFDMYATFSQVAKEEGFDSIATLFHQVGEIEKEHEQRYQKLLKNLEDNQVFSKPTEVTWICRHCGHHLVGKDAPHVCPVCSHPKAFFQVMAENY